MGFFFGTAEIYSQTNRRANTTRQRTHENNFVFDNSTNGYCDGNFFPPNSNIVVRMFLFLIKVIIMHRLG